MQHWSRNAVTYQIYPMSFKDSDGDGSGDLGGILEKIDYLNSNHGRDGKNSGKSLGINAVWLCPFYPSPMMDLGYDVSDFVGINPLFGDMKTFEQLVTELHARNIKVIIDFVGNHTSDKHPWFIESKSSKHSPKRDWYIWRDGTGDDKNFPPNNWISVFSGSAWERDLHTEQFYFHSFLKEQPDLNWRNPEVRQAMSEVIDFWVGKGVDGFRVDAFMHFIEDKLLRDDPVNPLYRKENNDPFNALLHTNSLEELDRTEIVGGFFKQVLEKHSDLLIVSEAYVGPKDIHKLQSICENERFTIFNFNFINRKWDALEYKKTIDEYLLDTPSYFLPNFVFGNHDVSRLASRIGEAQARLSAFLQFMLPGMLFVYYGEEIGMTDGTIPHHAIKDIIAKIFAGFHNGRDPERTPMQWDASPHAGFTSNKNPWLPVNDNYKMVNVAHESTDPQSMFSLYKKLIDFRSKNPVLRYGQYVPVEPHSASIFSFEMQLDDQRYFITTNFTDSVQKEVLPLDAKNPEIIFSSATDAYSTHKIFADPEANAPASLELMPFEGYVVRI